MNTLNRVVFSSDLITYSKEHDAQTRLEMIVYWHLKIFISIYLLQGAY